MTRDDILHWASHHGVDGEAVEDFAALVTESEQERIAKMFDKTWLNGRTVGDMIRERVQP